MILPNFVSPMLQPYLDQLHTPTQDTSDDNQNQEPNLIPDHPNHFSLFSFQSLTYINLILPNFVSPMLQPYLDQLHTPTQDTSDDNQNQEPNLIPDPPNHFSLFSFQSLTYINLILPNFVSPMLQPYLDQLHTPTQDTSDDNQNQEPNLIPDHPNQNPTLTTNLTNSTPHSAPPTLLHVSFNQDFGCFATGYDRGFRIYNCDPFNEIFRRDFDNEIGGGIGSVEMLFRCNILALVGGGENPQYPPNKVMIWDDHQSRCIGELSFRSEVRRVRLRRDRIVVVLEQKIFVYNFEDLKLLHQIETIANPKGLCVVSQSGAAFVLVCLGLQKGQVRVENYSTKRTKFVLAHDSRIACLALTQDGQFLATASTKGTLVRVYNTQEGTLLQEVRRGADRAEIYCLAFSSTAQWLAVSSDKGTVHVFSLKINLGNIGSSSNNTSDLDASVTVPGSSFSFIKGVLPKYFSSEWSVAQFRLPEGFQYVVAFGPEKSEGPEKHTVVILGMDGSFYKCKFDPMTRGEMIQLEYHNFVKPEAF